MSSTCTYLNDIFVGQRLVWLIVFCVLEQHSIHVCAGILIQLIAGREYDEGDLAVAQHRQLVGLLHDAEFAFVEGHLEDAKRGKEEKEIVSLKQNTLSISLCLLKYLCN